MAIENVFIGVASMPSRVDTLRQVVEALLPQCAQLGVYLNDYKSVPDFLNDPRILVARSQDHGDLRDNGKFFFLDKTEHKFYASVDDDIAYPNDYITKLLRNLKTSGGAGAVAVHGFLLPEKVTSITSNRYVFHFGASTPFLTPVNVVGTGTALFNQHKWKLKFSEFGDPGMSDVWFALAASKRQAPLWVIPRANKWMSPLEVESTTSNPKSAKSLFDEFKGRDAKQTALLNSVAISGSWSFYLKQMFSVEPAYRNYCLTQAMQAAVFAKELSWTNPSDELATTYLKVLRTKNASVLEKANATVRNRLSKRWVDQYSTLTMDFIRGRIDPFKTLDFIKQLPVLLAGIDESLLPNNFKWDARPDRQSQMKSFVVRTYRQGAEMTAAPEKLDGRSPLFIEYALEDLIAMANAGSRSDFFSHPEFLKLAKSNQDALLELAFRYLNSLPDFSKAELPSLVQWSEFFTQENLKKRAAVAYAYLLSKVGEMVGANELRRDLANSYGVDFEVMMLGVRFDMMAGHKVEPVADILSRLELNLGFGEYGKHLRKQPKVSIVVTSFNQAESLTATIENVLASNYENLEVIVVDDASTDHSQQVISDITDSRVRAICLTENGGPYLARNAALKIAKGDFIAFHDCGDYASPNRIQTQVELLLRNQNLKAVRSRHLRQTDDGLPIFENNAQFTGEAPVTMVVRRQIFKQLGTFLPTRTRGDVEFLRRIQAVYGDDSVALVNFPFYMASAPKNSVGFQHVTIRNFLRSCNAWHAAIKENPSVFDSWRIDGLLPFEIPRELSPQPDTTSKD